MKASLLHSAHISLCSSRKISGGMTGWSLSAVLCSLALSACTTTDQNTSALVPDAMQSVEVATATADPAPVLPAVVPVPMERGSDDIVLGFAAAQATMPAAMQVAYVAPNGKTSAVDDLITKYAYTYSVPENLVRRVVHRESRFNPAARNGPYWGLMQISHPTARGMGYTGEAKGLLDAETNLKYAVKYLAGAYLVAGGDENQTVRYYSSGYYYDAKRKGLLVETGLKK